MRRSRPKRGSRRPSGYQGSVWEETEGSSAGPKVFVVECKECGWSRGEMLGGLRRCLLGESSGQVLEFLEACSGSSAMEKVFLSFGEENGLERSVGG